MRLKNQVAIITGASQGLGLAVAKSFLNEGATVGICARNSEQLNNAHQELLNITSDERRVIAQSLDVSNFKEMHAFIKSVHQQTGQIDILVSNAGIYGPKGNSEEVDWEEWCYAVDVNLKGSVIASRAVLPYFKQQQKGKIIFLSGGGATKPLPFLSAYAVSKAAIVRYAETLAEELKPFNIDVNAIAPGALNTRLLDEVLKSGPEIIGDKFYEQSLKQKESGGESLEHAADLCCYLASSASNDITGKLISAVWDPWQKLDLFKEQLLNSDIYTLRRIVPEDRGHSWPVGAHHDAPARQVYRVGIIGCGLIGHKRAMNLSGAEFVACTDLVYSKAQDLAKQFDCVPIASWNELIAISEIDVVIIATPHKNLVEITSAAIKANKHVLVEKPAARSASELKPLLELSREYNVCVRVGFNHRYHRALQKAHQLVQEGCLGELMFIRARYGHGGRIGYDKEWRAKPEISGGGELIDQGVHLIDLSRWFLGDFTEVEGFAHTYYWDMPVDDNSFLMLKTSQKQVAFLHASCTEWKNTFSMEIYGKKGKLAIDGLGGSYGLEKLTWYNMLPEMGPPETTSWEYPMADNSWSLEWSEFMDDIRLNRQPSVSLQDAYAALKVVEKIYREFTYDRHTQPA